MTAIAELQREVQSQKFKLAHIYGTIDFDAMPYRFTTDPAAETQMRRELVDQRPRLLANVELVERIAAYTMLGDRVGDAYAGLIPEYGFKRLVDMVEEACDRGVENVEGAPPELIDFMAEMERVPDWIDMDLVLRGVELDRNTMTNLFGFAVRGGFLGTFMNKYAALPMAITGALTERTAGKRARETGSFFVASVLPGALERGGVGFKSAAMVRLMHSMVRFNIMRKGRWDSSVYGVPIPQIDQMAAGNSAAFFLSLKVLKKGRNHFTPDERAVVEFNRYRSYLLGVPQDLLPTTPQEIVDTMATRHATLRRAWDDDTCGALVRATMAADIASEEKRSEKLLSQFERSFAKFVLGKMYLDGDFDRVREIGIPVTFVDVLRAMVAVGYLATKVGRYAIGLRIPPLREFTRRRLIARTEYLYSRLGGAEFRTDASEYAHRGPGE